MDDLHLQADLFFGPCNDPECPAAQLASHEPRLELVWSKSWHQQLLQGPDHGPNGGPADC